MRILHVLYDDIHNPWLGGGGAVRAREINRRLARRHEITVLTGRYPGARDETLEGVRYRRVGTGRGYLASRLSYTLALPFAVRRRRFDLLVNDFSLFSPCFASWYTRQPVVGVFHHILGRHTFRKYPIVGVLPYCAERWEYTRTSRVITVSPSVTDAYRAQFPHDADIRCIPNGVDARLFEIPEGGDHYLLFLGRIDIYMKGLDTLVAAYRSVRGVQRPPLKIVGRGHARDLTALRQLIAEQGLQTDIQVCGPVTDRDKPDLLRHAMMVCLPSRFEGWGIVAVEAAAAGIPVVGTDIAGLRDAVRHGETGRLVPPEDPEALGEAIRWFLDRPDRRREYGRRGRDWARRFEWDAIAREQEAFYAAVVTGSADRSENSVLS